MLLAFVFILETGGWGPGSGLGFSDISHNGGGSKPGRAGPGRAVAQVGAGDDGAEVGGNVKRGRTVPQCTALAGVGVGKGGLSLGCRSGGGCICAKKAAWCFVNSV